MKDMYLKDPFPNEHRCSPWCLIEDSANLWGSPPRTAPKQAVRPLSYSVFSYSSIAKLVVVNLILLALIFQTRMLYRIEAGVEPAPKSAPPGGSLILAGTSSGGLEERFQKISTVLSYLLNQRILATPQGSGTEGELPVATVIVDKAYLRTGPGKEHSPVMALSRGTRLVVERQEGSWYEVTGPTGQRLWAAGEVIEVQKG